jgi:hypothetical protein
MSYRVFWTPDAERWLEEILRDCEDPVVIASAAREIDRSLVENAVGVGESRYENVRIAFERPLAVQFEIFSDVATVIVFDVWRTDRRQ